MNSVSCLPNWITSSITEYGGRTSLLSCTMASDQSTSGGRYSGNTSGVTYACDMRSDTVTVPCAGMKQAMFDAVVGDDVIDVDPTIVKLEKHVAEICGKEAALFVASGTMSNQLAMRVHLQALESVLMDHRAHIYVYECGGVAAHSQAQIVPVRPLPGNLHLTAEALEKAIVTENVHHPTTTLISLENTLNGSVMPFESIKAIREMATRRGLRVHMDGARLWNACVASGVSLREYSSCVDSLSLCLSKGMGAPIGSVLVGPQAFINKARKFRKMFGGGWRQAGFLAAAGLYAIEHNWGQSMADVHANARFLGDELKQLGFDINKDYNGVVETNMVWITNEKPFQATGVTMGQIAKKACENGIALWGDDSNGTGGTARVVLHHQVYKDELLRLVKLIKDTLTAGRS